MVDNSLPADINLFIGATGAGKSTALKQHLGKPARLLVWDPKDEYSDVKEAGTLAELFDLTTNKGGKPRARFRVRYVPRRVDRKERERAFSSVCSLALFIGKVSLIAEELSLVTRSNGGPPGYEELILTGRASGVSVFGTSQRPARVDKDIFSNASRIWCGRLAWDDDAVLMAKALRVPVRELNELTGHQSIARDKLSGDLFRDGKREKK